jgi:serine/threonine protein kinase
MNPERVADYQIIDSLGGWEGESMYIAVPPARLTGAGQRVLLKVVGGLTGARAMERATEELRIFSAVDSPNIVRLLDAGQDGDRLFYATDLPTLGTLSQPERTLSPTEQMAAVADACRGAHDLHEVGVVHRSISPSRVLLGQEGAKLADLSLARFAAAGMVTTTMPDLRELEFMDPALLKGAAPSRASDIWSLGAVLHFALSGGASLYPDLPREPLASVRHVLSVSPVLDSRVPPAVADCVRTAVDPDAEARPITALELAKSIEQIRGSI